MRSVRVWGETRTLCAVCVSGVRSRAVRSVRVWGETRTLCAVCVQRERERLQNVSAPTPWLGALQVVRFGGRHFSQRQFLLNNSAPFCEKLKLSPFKEHVPPFFKASVKKEKMCYFV